MILMCMIISCGVVIIIVESFKLFLSVCTSQFSAVVLALSDAHHYNLNPKWEIIVSHSTGDTMIVTHQYQFM